MRHVNRQSAAGGNIIVTSTVLVDLDNAAFDITIPASVGDKIEVGFSGVWLTGTEVSELEPFTIVGGVPINSLPGTSPLGSSKVQWTGRAGVEDKVMGSIFYRVVATDLFSGPVTGQQVLIRWRTRIRTAGTRTLLRTSDDRLGCFVFNYGTTQTNP